MVSAGKCDRIVSGYGYLSGEPPSSPASTLEALAGSDFRPLLPGITVPTLVLCGANDKSRLPASRLMASSIPHAELQVIAGAGHIWNLEQPDVFGKTLLTFLSRVDAESL
jgi:3-oxoadipate enol-lactonase